MKTYTYKQCFIFNEYGQWRFTYVPTMTTANYKFDTIAAVKRHIDRFLTKRQ